MSPTIKNNLTPKDIKRIGVLTGGGDAPGLNGVIRAVVKTAIGEYGWRVFGIKDGFEGLVKGQIDEMGLVDVRGILPRGGTILGTTNHGNPFAMPDKQSGSGPETDHSPWAIQNLKRKKIDALAIIGGEGTMAIANEFWQLGVPLVGIPKTIDNDVVGTDLTFGFGSAVITAVEAIDKIYTTAESHHRVMVVEVMGRDVGWIALHSGLASGADVILIPEIPYNIKSIVEKIRDRDSNNQHFTIIVLAEGARDKKGTQVTYKSTTGHIRLGGIGDILARELGPLVDHDVRVTTLGHIQRGGSPSPNDRILGSRFGFEAVRLLACGDFGKMVALNKDVIVSVPLDEIAGKVKTVPSDHGMIIMARSLGVCLGD